MPCISTSHGPQVNRSRHPYQYVTSHISMRHVTNIKVSVVLRGAQLFALCLRRRTASTSHYQSTFWRHVAHINEPCRKQATSDTCLESRCTYQRVVMHRLISHVAPINISCCAYQYVTLHLSIRHVAHINAWHCTYQRVVVHMLISHVVRINTSRCTYQYVTLHIK